MENNKTNHQLKPSAWELELERFKSIKTTFILEGNIYDLHAYSMEMNDEVRWMINPLDYYLYQYLVNKGYGTVIFYNHIDGFYNEYNEDHLKQFLQLAKGREVASKNQEQPNVQQTEDVERNEKSRKVTIDKATEMIRAAMEASNHPIGVILNLSSRYVTSPEELTDEERQFYSRLFLTTQKRRQHRIETTNQYVNNLLFFISNKANDIPAWFYLDNPYVKTLHIPKPDRKTRARFIESQFRGFVGSQEVTVEEQEQLKQQFIDLTEGFTNIELNGLRVLCRQEQIHIRQIAEHFQNSLFVSNEHAQIELSENGYVLIDLNSTNGTKINGMTIESGKQYSIPIGTRITIANLDYQVREL